MCFYALKILYFLKVRIGSVVSLVYPQIFLLFEGENMVSSFHSLSSTGRSGLPQGTVRFDITIVYKQQETLGECRPPPRPTIPLRIQPPTTQLY